MIASVNFPLAGGRGENKTPGWKRRVVRQWRECNGIASDESSSLAKHRALRTSLLMFDSGDDARAWEMRASSNESGELFVAIYLCGIWNAARKREAEHISHNPIVIASWLWGDLMVAR
jgi:hypothetical protein